MTARPWPPKPPFPRRDKEEEEEEFFAFEKEASSGWSPAAWQQGFVIPSPIPGEKENVFLAVPWRSKTWDESEISRTSRASCDDTHPFFPFSPVPVDRSASAVLRYGCWPALLSFVTDLSVALYPLSSQQSFVFSWETKRRKNKKRIKQRLSSMLPTTLRNALLSIAIFLPAHVLADDDDSSDIVTFQFSACVSTCLGTTGYSMDGEDNQKEMCKASRDGLLEAIIACTVSSCVEELVALDTNLLQPMQTGCKELEKPVSDDEIADAANAAVNIQATLGASTSTSTTSSTSIVPLPVVISPTTPTFQPLGVGTETATTSDLLATPVPAETPAAVEPAAETTTLSPALTILTEPTIAQPEPDVPAETQTSTSELSIPSETQPPPEPVTSAESSSTTAAAIVPVAQITDISPAQPAPETTTVAEQPSDPAPSPTPASVSTSATAGNHANQISAETTQEATPATTVVKPSSTANANAQSQQTTAPEQAPANNPIADTTTSTEASKTESSGPKATPSEGSRDDDEEDPSSSETSTATQDTSGELVLATGTPTASSASGFATSVTATPSASGTQPAASGDADRGLGGGSPFSVVMASAAPGGVSPWWAPLCVTLGMVVSLMF